MVLPTAIISAFRGPTTRFVRHHSGQPPIFPFCFTFGEDPSPSVSSDLDLCIPVFLAIAATLFPQRERLCVQFHATGQRQARSAPPGWCPGLVPRTELLALPALPWEPRPPCWPVLPRAGPQ